MGCIQNTIKIVFTGGGTAGHITPGVAVFEDLRKYALTIKGQAGTFTPEVVWICSRSNTEQMLLDTYGIPFKFIFTGKLRRYFSIKNFFDIFLVIIGFIQSLFILRNEKPAILFSKGGFVSLSPVLAARMLRIPIIIHESDYDPGLTTRITARFANKILIPFKESNIFYPESYKKKIMVTGNPMRSGILNGSKLRGLSYCGIKNNKKIIFIVGGSQGALQINKLLEKCVGELCEQFIVIHQTGGNWTFEFKHPNYRAYNYINAQYADIAAAADIVVSRAGAGAVWEFAVLGKPMILIPKGLDSSRGDQVRNAEFFEKKHAAIVLKGKKVNTENLINAILTILKNDDLRITLAKNAALLCDMNAKGKIIDVIIKQIGGSYDV